METLRNRVLNNLKERRNRLLNNKLNCIPSPFQRFSNDFVGLEQDCMYCITSSTKGSKSQFTSYTFIYKPLMFCYNTNADIGIKIIYFPLEETPERIMQRFISWLLYEHSDGKIRISPRDLRSTQTPVSQEILDIIASDEIQDIIKYFEDHVIFPDEKCNPTGIYMYCKRYAEEHGTVHTKPGKYTNELGEIIDYQAFDYYEQDNPNEYRIIIIDTINLIDQEKSMNLKQSMDKMSEYCAKYLRNRYHYSPVIIQQQAMQGESTEAIKFNNYTPSVANAGDSKTIQRDVNISLGLFSPFKFGLKEYMGYDIGIFKDNIRFLSILINRDGSMGGVCPLYFDGAVCMFKELPAPDSPDIKKVYEYLRSNKTKKLFFKYKKKRKHGSNCSNFGFIRRWKNYFHNNKS